MIYYDYLNREVHHEINSRLGDAYGLMDLLKLGKVESGPMTVLEVSKGFMAFTRQDQHMTHATIQLRPKGLLVAVSNNQQTLNWAIPYYQLTIYKTGGLSLHSSGEFLILELADNRDKRFIKKMMDLRNRYLEQYTFI